MKYTVRFACGHEGVVELFGKTEDRERKLLNLEQEMCPACQKTARAERAKAEQEAAHAAGLPDLNGTEKQVRWAVSLRNAVLHNADVVLEAGKEQHSEETTVYRYCEGVRHWMQTETNASVIIDSWQNMYEANALSAAWSLLQPSRIDRPDSRKWKVWKEAGGKVR